MRRITHIVSTISFSDYERRTLEQLLPETSISYYNRHETKQLLLQSLKKADVAFLNGDVFPGFLEAAPNIKWIHCNHAGLNDSCKPQIFEKNIILTGASGRSNEALAEHVFFFVFSLAYRSEELYLAKRNHTWGFPGINELLALHSKTMLIIGTGGIGKAVAHLAKSFYMNTIGFSYSSKDAMQIFDKQYCKELGDDIDSLLPLADYVVLTLPLSDNTYHMFQANQFQAMKKTAFFINLSRGLIANEEDLLEALKQNTIAGAGLDAFSIEPLPKNHPLWDAPNTVITPHQTPRLDVRNERSFQILTNNISNYTNEQAMLNQVTTRDIFTRKE